MRTCVGGADQSLPTDASHMKRDLTLRVRLDIHLNVELRPVPNGTGRFHYAPPYVIRARA